MARTGLRDIDALPDPLLAHQFDLFITGMPVGDSRDLAVRCESAVWPGYQNEPVMMRLHGVTRPTAGAAVYEHDFATVINETRDLKARNSIMAWLEFIRSVRNTTGSYVSEYAAVANLVQYDDRNNAIRTTRCFGFYPERIDTVQLSGASGNEIVKYNVNFKYFYTAES